jgi:hypothetical protein
MILCVSVPDLVRAKGNTPEVTVKISADVRHMLNKKHSTQKLLFSEDSSRRRITSNRVHELLICAMNIN